MILVRGKGAFDRRVLRVAAYDHRSAGFLRRDWKVLHGSLRRFHIRKLKRKQAYPATERPTSGFDTNIFRTSGFT